MFITRIPSSANPRSTSIGTIRSVAATGPDMRSRSAAVTVSRSGRLMLLMSHLPRRVALPSRVCRDILSLHQEGVGGQHRAITHRYVVVDEGVDSDRAAGSKRAPAGLEGAV